MDLLDDHVQDHVRDRLLEALDGRSWNWLSQQIEVPQSTLSNQVTAPRFTLETIARAARILRKPVGWFFPDHGDVSVEEAARAFREVERVVKSAREGAYATGPDGEPNDARDLADRAREGVEGSRQENGGAPHQRNQG